MAENLPTVLEPRVSTCASLGMFGWRSGPLGLWTYEVSAFVHWIEQAGPAPLPLPIHFHLLSSPEELSSALWNGGNAEGEAEIRACSSRRSIAWHYPPAIPSAPLSSSLLCSWCVSLNLFFSISFFPSDCLFPLLLLLLLMAFYWCYSHINE